MILAALVKKYEAEMAAAEANIEVYMDNPVGIGEHPDVLGAIQDQVDVIAKEQERIDIIEKYFNE